MCGWVAVRSSSKGFAPYFGVQLMTDPRHRTLPVQDARQGGPEHR